jgi:acetyl-CoA carboxylase biotin carboxyl carrier protein
MGQKDSDFQKIKKLIKIMTDNELVEVEIKHGDDKILLKRAQPQQTVAALPIVGQNTSSPSAETVPVQSAPPAEQPAEQKNDGLVEIKSLMIGTFYAKPSPDSEPYVEVGSNVDPQTVVCVIEAMKVMNEIKAETSGTIAEICVTNGQAVEYGQVLFKIKPD